MVIFTFELGDIFAFDYRYVKVSMFDAGVWWIGVDPDSFDTCGITKSSGMGHVCVHILLFHDHPLVLYIPHWKKQEQHLA